MAQELVYTSAERGLRPGTRGFCTVAYTQGMRPESVRLLEALSAYKSLFAVHDARIELEPVAISHYRMTVCGRSVSVLSRVAPTLADHTMRSNKVAHHVVLSARERPGGGPAWLASQPAFFRDGWEGEPRVLAEPPEVPEGDCESLQPVTWEAMTGDAGWAGALAYAFLARPTVPAYLVFEPGTNPLALLREALAFVPLEQRWGVTFNTYFCTLPAGTSCSWRCCVPDSEGVREARRNPRALVLDLTKPVGAPPEHGLVKSAREGRLPEPPPEKTEKAEKEPVSEPQFVLLPDRAKRTHRMRPYVPRQEPDSGSDTATPRRSPGLR